MDPSFLVYAGLLGGIFLVVWLLGARHDAEQRARDLRTRAMVDELTKDEAAKTDRLLQRTPRQLWVAGSGTPATARIVAATQTNTMINLRPLVDLTLEVEGPDGPYQVRMQVVVSLLDTPSCQQGETVDVRIDPESPGDVVVLF